MMFPIDPVIEAYRDPKSKLDHECPYCIWLNLLTKRIFYKCSLGWIDPVENKIIEFEKDDEDESCQ